MKTKTRQTPENIIVFPVNKDKLDSAINDKFHKEGKPANTNYHTAGIGALMLEPKECVIDDEFVGHDIKGDVTFYIYETEGRTHNMLPTFEVTLTLTELKPFLNNSVTLAEFTKNRRGYNSRIITNEREWMRYLNKP